MVVIKWSVSSPSTPTIRVRIPPTVFAVKFVFEMTKNKQKEEGVALFSQKSFKTLIGADSTFECLVTRKL